MTERSMLKIDDVVRMPDGDLWRVAHFHDEPNTGLCTLERQDITRFKVAVPVSWVLAITDRLGDVEVSDFDTPDEREAFTRGRMSGRVLEREDVVAYGARTLGHNYWFVQEVRNCDHVGAHAEVPKR